MRTRFRLALAALAATLASTLVIAGVAQATASPSTPVHLSQAQVAQTLFVAGDVGRLSLIPSGTESVVLEKVLQQLYTDNPTLASSQAVTDIQGLQAALASGSQAISPATLTVMGGNERILAILRALTASNPAPEAQHALAQVTNQALTVSERSTQFLGQSFDASADSLDTLSFNAFSPEGTLAHTWVLASSDNEFGQARDTLWKQVSNESVFDSTQTLLGENPALQNSAIRSLVNMTAPDGSLDTTVGALESLIDGGIQQIAGANCTIASGTSGTSPNDCASGALHDAQLVAQNCPNGPTDTSASCQTARNQAQSDQPGELATINDEQAATAAEANALGAADQTLALVNAAETQAGAQLAEEENAYLNNQSFQQAEKAGFDVLSLGVSLSVSEIDPVAAVGALLNVVGDATGFAFSGPDPNTLILQGIQGIAQQLSDFEQYTEGAFQVVDAQLGNLSTQVSQIAAQITNAQQQLTQLATQVANLQSSVDHLQSEVQSLFAQGARNDLGTLVNQYIGFQQANGTPLPQTQFAQAAGALYQDATSTAVTQTLLTVPTGFDAVNADSLVAGTDPLTLDTNINLFNYFGAGVTDAPASVGWPGALTTTCPPNANPGQGLCLPDPDFWATSARAFSQLLLENPSYVTPTRIAQLQAIQQEGQLIANALSQLSVDNAGADAGGTGNKTLDAALNYFRYWGDGNNHAGGTPPSLWQAIKKEEQTYLSTLPVATSPQMDVSPVNPWGSPQQLPDTAGVQKLTSLQNIPVCSNVAGFYGDPNIAGKTLPSLPTSLIAGIDPQFQTAARLGLGTISACWYAAYTGTDGNNFASLVAEIQYYWTGQGNTHVEIAKADTSLSEVFDCAGTPDPMKSFAPDVLATVVGGWLTGASGCPDLSGDFGLVNLSAPAAFSAASTAVENELSSLRRDVYNHIISGRRRPHRRRFAGRQRAAGRDPPGRRQRASRRVRLARVAAGARQRRRPSGSRLRYELRHVRADERWSRRDGAGPERARAGREPVRGRDQRRPDQQRPAGHGSRRPDREPGRPARLAAGRRDQRAHRSAGRERARPPGPRPAEPGHRDGSDHERNFRRGKPVHRPDARSSRRDRVRAERSAQHRAPAGDHKPEPDHHPGPDDDHGDFGGARGKVRAQADRQQGPAGRAEGKGQEGRAGGQAGDAHPHGQVQSGGQGQADRHAHRAHRQEAEARQAEVEDVQARAGERRGQGGTRAHAHGQAAGGGGDRAR